MSSVAPGEWLTTEEAAALLKVHPHTIYRWCQAGKLAYVRVGKAYRVQAAALVNMVAAQPIHSAAQSDQLPPVTGHVIAIANQKGGAGKTSTTINLGSALAERGLRVLIIDCDQQANATLVLTGNMDVAPGLPEVLMQEYDPARVVLPTNESNLWLLPSSMELANIETAYAAAPGREFLLRPAVAELRRSYHYVLLDCPPSLGVMTVSAMVAASELLIPIVPQLFSTVGLRMFDRTVRMVRDRMGHHDLRILGVLISRASGQIKDGLPRTIAYRNVIANLRELYGDTVFRTIIPEAVAVEEAHQAGTGIVHWRSASPAAMAYRELAKEVIERGA